MQTAVGLATRTEVDDIWQLTNFKASNFCI